LYLIEKAKKNVGYVLQWQCCCNP